MTQPVDILQSGPNGETFSCDWYSCLVDETPDNIIERLDQAMNLSEIKPCSGVPQYERSVALWSHNHSDRPMFELSFGGNQGSSPHLVSKGYVADQGMRVIRWAYPAHRVGRMDVALDLKGDGLYERISGELHKLHRAHGLKTRTINHDVPDMGRTHYLGSRQSVAMVRCYEKDKEQASKGLPFITGHVRLELEVKPQKRGDRITWAGVSLQAAWGVSGWTKTLLSRVLSLDAEAIPREPPMKRTDEETWAQILAMHSRLIHRLGEDRAMELLRLTFTDGSKGVDQDVRSAAAA